MAISSDISNLPSLQAPTKASKAVTIDEARRVGTKTTLDQAAKGFEALFAQTMLKQMHEGKLDDGILDSEEQKPFQSLLDNAYADLMTKQSKFGIADAINKTFASRVNTPSTPRNTPIS